MIFLTLATVTGQMWCAPFGGLLTSIQPIILFCVILKKSDAKKYIVELVTLSYCNCHCNCVGGKVEVVERDATTRISTSILGFDITVDDEDSDAPNGDDRAITGMDVETAKDDVVGEAETDGEGGPGGDLESSKHSHASRRYGGRPMAVLMTGETANVTSSGASDVPSTAWSVASDANQRHVRRN